MVGPQSETRQARRHYHRPYGKEPWIHPSPKPLKACSKDRHYLVDPGGRPPRGFGIARCGGDERQQQRHLQRAGDHFGRHQALGEVANQCAAGKYQRDALPPSHPSRRAQTHHEQRNPDGEVARNPHETPSRDFLRQAPVRIVVGAHVGTDALGVASQHHDVVFGTKAEQWSLQETRRRRVPSR
ncbi:MAG: hypothetical protein OXK76_19945 [Gammaproteobacteria bacterium]|nr:hypothetical protein [Gammaproteobacteria bacterium]